MTNRNDVVRIVAEAAAVFTACVATVALLMMPVLSALK